MLKAKARLAEEESQRQQQAAAAARAAAAAAPEERDPADAGEEALKGAVPVGGADGSPAIELEHAIAFNGAVHGSLVMHPNGKNYITVTGGCVVINDLTDAHNQVFLRGHDDDVSCLVLSPSGRFIASGQIGDNSDVIVWDFEQNALVWRLSEHFHGIQCISFSDDERFLCTIGDATDKKMLVWDLHTGNLVCSQYANPAPTRCVAWGGRVKDVKRRPTADYLLATGGNDCVRLWSMTPATGVLTSSVCHILHLTRNYTCMSFSRDGELLYVGTESGDFIVCSMRNQTMFARIAACAVRVESLTLDGHGRLFIGGGDGSIVAFAEQEKQYTEIARARLGAAVTSMSLSADAVEMGVGTHDGTLYRVRTATFDCALIAEAHSAAVTAVAYAPGNSEQFATCSADGSVRVWDASTYAVLARAFVRAAVPACVLLAEECTVSGWSDGKIRAHDCANGEALWDIKDAHLGGVTALAFSPNGKFLVSGGTNGELRVWEIRSRELVCHLKEHTGRVNSVAIFDDNLHVLSCSRDRSFLCWDLQQEKRVSSHVQRMGGLNTMALSRDQQVILTAGQEKRITFWDLRAVNPVQAIYPAHAGEATCLAISHDGTLFATGGTDERVKLWDFASGSCLADGVGHSATVTAVHFSPDDRQLVSTGADGGVYVWNVYR